MDVDKAQESDPANGNPLSFPMADLVTLESVVNLLVQKGIITAEEFYDEEQKRRSGVDSFSGISVAQTDSGDAGRHRHRKSGWLKRKMSKKRWTRKLGSSLFGWEWKKSKSSKAKRSLEESAEET